jgi:hypothetical protein
MSAKRWASMMLANSMDALAFSARLLRTLIGLAVQLGSDAYW